jgi:hypothetical protein
VNVNLTKRKPAATAPEVALVERPAKPGGKNSPTPRRNAARAQRAKTLKGKPVSKKEAKARTRAAYDSTREQLKSKDPSQLPANERVPELVYVRDLVDSRTNLASALIPVAVIYFIATFVISSVVKNRGLQTSIFFLTFFWLLAILVDVWIMSRKIDAAVQARHPQTTARVRGYAVKRAIALKRMRRPVVREVPEANRWKSR